VYAAASTQEKVRTDPKAAPRILHAWLDHRPEHLWLDLTAPTAEELSFIRERFGLHPLAVEECDHTGVRPKIEEYPDHLYLVLHGMNHNAGEDLLDTVEFKIFLGKGMLITIHDSPSSSIRGGQERVQRDPKLLSSGGVDRVLHVIVDAIIDHYFPVLEALEAKVQELEHAIFREPQPAQLEEMLGLQRRLLTLHRLIYPQLDILGALSSGRFSSIDPEEVVYFRDVHDHLVRINDRLSLAREMLSGAMQCYLSQSGNRMNAVMKSMALLATIALPASFLTGLFGMNLEHLPGRGSGETFWWVTGISLLISAGTFAMLKRLRWL
jgi:magnesium transporter